MSLATRCTSCGTVFRVVQDQLKVSEGWVRCGRCDAVFNALEGLFDLNRDAPPEWNQVPDATPHHPEVDVEVEELDAQGRDTDHDLARDPSLVDRIDEQLFGARRSAFGGLASLARERSTPDFADARFDSESPDEAHEPALIDATPVPLPTDEGAGPDRPDAGESPQFLRDAERQRRWQGSRARRLLAAAVLLLLMLLGVQVMHHYRDDVASRWPVTQPLLLAWCGAAGCSLAAPRRIDDVVVESTSLSRAAGAEGFRLAVVLRNRAALPVALPWLELSLTDANGELVARRALSPDDLRAPSPAIAGHGEASLLVALVTGSARITGYTVEVFYP